MLRRYMQIPVWHEAHRGTADAILAEMIPLPAGDILVWLLYFFSGYFVFPWFEAQAKRRAIFEAFLQEGFCSTGSYPCCRNVRRKEEGLNPHLASGKELQYGFLTSPKLHCC